MRKYEYFGRSTSRGTSPGRHRPLTLLCYEQAREVVNQSDSGQAIPSHSQPARNRRQMNGGFEDGAVSKPDESPSEQDHRNGGSSGGLSANGRMRNGEAGTGSNSHRGRTFNGSHAVNGSTETVPEERKGDASNGSARSHRSTDSCGGALELRTPPTGDSMTLRLTEEEELAAFGGGGRGSGESGQDFPTYAYRT